VTRRAAIALAVVVAWLTGSTLGSHVGLPAAAARTPAIVVGRAHGGYTPELGGQRTITILAVGSDARPGQNPLRLRADSIHLIFLNPRKRQAVIAGIPRDSYVGIPGHGSNKINSAMSSGGPALLVRTIEKAFSTRIDYWAVTSFWGIERMVDGVGGLRVRVPFRMQDADSKSNFHSGVQRLRGREVLAFSRDRHSVPGGDFGRQENGGRVLEGALIQFKREYRRDPSRLLTWVAIGARHMDTDIPIAELVELAFTASRVRPEHVRNLVIPGSIGAAGSLSIVRPWIGWTRAIFRDAMRDGALKHGNVPPSPTGAR
jgi:LCP family protein required for cell wall assembly